MLTRFTDLAESKNYEFHELPHHVKNMAEACRAAYNAWIWIDDTTPELRENDFYQQVGGMALSLQQQWQMLEHLTDQLYAGWLRSPENKDGYTYNPIDGFVKHKHKEEDSSHGA